jgi:hypothetical protein
MFRNSYMLLVLLLTFSLGCTQTEWVSKKMEDIKKNHEERKAFAKTGSTSDNEGVSSAQVPDPTKRDELTFTLTDNSVIVGKFLQEELDFNSQFGALKVKGKDIDSFNEGILHLEDGTTLQGSLALEEVGIISEFGEIQIKVVDITGIVR